MFNEKLAQVINVINAQFGALHESGAEKWVHQMGGIAILSQCQKCYGAFFLFLKKRWFKLVFVFMQMPKRKILASLQQRYKG